MSGGGNDTAAMMIGEQAQQQAQQTGGAVQPQIQPDGSIQWASTPQATTPSTTTSQSPAYNLANAVTTPTVNTNNIAATSSYPSNGTPSANFTYPQAGSSGTQSAPQQAPQNYQGLISSILGSFQQPNVPNIAPTNMPTVQGSIQQFTQPTVASPASSGSPLAALSSGGK